jgi:hypothetical protein
LSGWDYLLSRAEPNDHMVQFYDTDHQLLVAKIGHYLAEGCKAGDASLVVAAPDRNLAIAGQLGLLGVNTVAEAAAWFSSKRRK